VSRRSRRVAPAGQCARRGCVVPHGRSPKVRCAPARLFSPAHKTGLPVISLGNPEHCGQMRAKPLPSLSGTSSDLGRECLGLPLPFGNVFAETSREVHRQQQQVWAACAKWPVPSLLYGMEWVALRRPLLREKQDSKFARVFAANTIATQPYSVNTDPTFSAQVLYHHGRIIAPVASKSFCFLPQPQTISSLAHRGKALGDGLFVTRRPTDFSKRDAPLVQTERPEPPRWGRYTPPASIESRRSPSLADRVDGSPRRCDTHTPLSMVAPCPCSGDL
jgi:hypothetical protein